MNEHEWAECSASKVMLSSLPRAGLGRKHRLYACACARRLCHLVDDERPSRALEVAERFADGLADRKELKRASYDVRRFAADMERQQKWVFSFAALSAQNASGTFSCEDRTDAETRACAGEAAFAAVLAAGCAAKAGIQGNEGYERYAQAEVAERAAEADLLRDIFGNPFRPAPVFDSSWRTSPVIALANEIYEHKAFDQLPALAELLQGSGCANQELLDHLGHPAIHVRGCWALDAALGKE